MAKISCSFCGKAGDHGHRIGIVGSRDFPQLELVREFISKVPGRWTVVSGGARGVDHEAERWARKNGLKLEVMQAKWNEFGKSAGFKRNAELVEAVDCLVAFWDGASHGTAHTIQLARQQLGAKRVRVIERKLSTEQRHALDTAANEKAAAIARGEATTTRHAIEMHHEWRATEAAWREAIGIDGHDILDPERDIERAHWDDELHQPKFGTYRVICEPTTRINTKVTRTITNDGIYVGHEPIQLSTPSKLALQAERWDDPLELDTTDGEGLVANWEELTSEQLDFIDSCTDSFWSPIFRKCISEHRAVTPKMLDMAMHPRFA